MIANELMIGDWVFTRGRIEQVTSIYDGYICTEHYEDSHDYYFEPIPLTTEILEKNGFEEFDGWRILDMDDVEIRWIGTILEISGSHGNMELPNVQCVHELQHALRLCGIEKEIVL